MKLARGLAWNYTSYALEAIVGLGLVSFVVRRVGVPDYGVLTLALAISSLLTVLDLGLLGLLVQAFVGERESGGISAVSSLLSASIKRLAVSGIAGFVACVAIAMILPGPFSIEPGLVIIARSCLILVGAALVVTLPSIAVELAYVAAGAFGAIARVQIATILVRAVATVIALQMGYGVVALASIHLLTAVVKASFLWGGLSQSTGGVRISGGQPVGDRLASLRLNRRWATADNIARQIASSADSITLGILTSSAAVATFGVGKRIPGQLLAITNKGVDVTLPFFSGQHHRDEEGELGRLFASTLLATATILIPICVAGLIFAPTIVIQLAGPNYASAIPILRWLLGATLVQAFSVPAYAVLYARGRISTAAKISIGEAIANVALTIALVPRYGGTGAAAATAITHSVGTFGWFLPSAMKAAQISPRQLGDSLLSRARYLTTRYQRA